MVMKFAHAEQKAIESSQLVEKCDVRVRDANRERDVLSGKLRTAKGELQSLQNKLDSKVLDLCE